MGEGMRARWRRWTQETRTKVEGLKWDTLALYLAYRDSRTPARAKWIIALTVGYALSPIDLIPDFIPILGYVDDLIIVPMGIRYATKLVPPSVFQECRARAQVEFRRGSPKSWMAAAVIVLLWAAVLAFAMYLLLRIFA